MGFSEPRSLRFFCRIYIQLYSLSKIYIKFTPTQQLIQSPKNVANREKYFHTTMLGSVVLKSYAKTETIVSGLANYHIVTLSTVTSLQSRLIGTLLLRERIVALFMISILLSAIQTICSNDAGRQVVQNNIHLHIRLAIRFCDKVSKLRRDGSGKKIQRATTCT